MIEKNKRDLLRQDLSQTIKKRKELEKELKRVEKAVRQRGQNKKAQTE